MRTVYIICLLLMLLFIGVQFNDPDGADWMIIYAIPAIWAAIAAFRHSLLGNKIIHFILLFCIFLSIGGMIYLWPVTPGWWRQEVWWETETAREGMGLMIVTLVMLAVWLGRPRPARHISQVSSHDK